MTQEELSLLDEREREAWELCQKVTEDWVVSGDSIKRGISAEHPNGIEAALVCVQEKRG